MNEQDQVPERRARKMRSRTVSFLNSSPTMRCFFLTLAFTLPQLRCLHLTLAVFDAPFYIVRKKAILLIFPSKSDVVFSVLLGKDGHALAIMTK